LLPNFLRVTSSHREVSSLTKGEFTSDRSKKKFGSQKVQITARDRALFEAICKHNFLSTEQIHSSVFPIVGYSTVLRRLRSLESSYYLVRIGMLNCRTQVWGNTQLANDRFTAFVSPSRTNLHTLEHDVMLNDVRFAMEEATNIEAWYDLRHFTRNLIPQALRWSFGPDNFNFKKGGSTLTPDNIFTVSVDGVAKHFALELELSLKARSRYRDLMYEYCRNNGLSGVLYVAATESIASVVLDAAANQPVLRNSLYVTDLQGLLRNGAQTVLLRARNEPSLLSEVFPLKGGTRAQAPAHHVGAEVGGLPLA
jgi:hypothetical protein